MSYRRMNVSFRTLFDRAESLRLDMERRVLSRAGQVYISDLACIVDRPLLAGGSASIRLAAKRQEPMSTMLARYQRAGTPTPKQLQDGFRLWLAHRLMAEGFIVSQAAEALGASSPQAFGRMVRRVTGRTPTEFAALPAEEVWTRYVEIVIAPYLTERQQRAA